MDVSNTVQNLKMLLPLLYILPTYVLYCIIVYIIFISKNKKKFAASFYKLFGISAIVYPSCSIVYFIAIRIPNTPFFTPFVKLWGIRSVLVTFLQTALWYVTNVAPLFHLAVSFNRFTVFILKTRYEQFWEDWLRVIAGISLALPFLFIWHIPFCDIFMKFKNYSDPDSLRYLAAANREAVPWMNNPRNAAMVMTFCSVMSLIFNFYCVTKLLIEKFVWKNNTNRKKTSKSDILLTVYTMLVFVCDALHCFHQYTILTVENQATIDLMFEIQYYLFDISDLAPAWFILITNKNLRNHMLHYLLHKKTKVIFISQSMRNSVVGVTGGVTHR